MHLLWWPHAKYRQWQYFSLHIQYLYCISTLCWPFLNIFNHSFYYGIPLGWHIRYMSLQRDVCHSSGGNIRCMRWHMWVAYGCNVIYIYICVCVCVWYLQLLELGHTQIWLKICYVCIHVQIISSRLWNKYMCQSTHWNQNMENFKDENPFKTVACKTVVIWSLSRYGMQRVLWLTASNILARN